LQDLLATSGGQTQGKDFLPDKIRKTMGVKIAD
jgi:hypothetical protein